MKRFDLGETDRLLTLFTLERGKVRAINRGARKPLSKLAGHLEPFALANIQLHEGRSFYTITAAETVDPYFSLRNDLSQTGRAYYFLELVDSLLGEDEPQTRLFNLLRETLTWQARSSFPLMTAAFRLKLLVITGYRPELSYCANCRLNLEPRDNSFSYRLGGILGPECRTEDSTATPVSPTAIKALRFLADQPFGSIVRLANEPTLCQQLELVTENYLQYQVGRPIRSADFMRQAIRLA